MADTVDRLGASLTDRYRIEREVGQGGMAIVYLAEDVRHHRKVAIKVLRPEVAAVLGAERFLREIAVTARLDHPHILPLLDSGEAGSGADAFLYYVMPFVEGESLRDRLDRERQLPLADALAITREVGDALSYAHSQGIIHRDIKPENIMLSGSHARVADFGIARAISSAGGERLTQTGMTIGTPSYMSPEQAAGETQLDGRSDLYALGCVLYEMLAGRPPFTGPTVESIVHQHLVATPPPIVTVRPTVPANTAAALDRALAKNPADRFHPVARFTEALQPSSAVSSPQTEIRARARWWPWATAAALLGVAVVAFALFAGNRAMNLSLGRRTQLTLDPGLEIDPAVSPDGQFIAYAAGPMAETRIYVRQIEGGTPIALAPELGQPQRLPFWSPDGKRILFRSPRGIEVIPALGGVPKLLVSSEGIGVPRSGSPYGLLMPEGWSPDGRQFAFARFDSIYVAPLDGGSPRLLAEGEEFHSMAWSPDGRWIAAVGGNRQAVEPGFFFGNKGQSSIWLIPVDGGKPIVATNVGASDASPVWLSDSRNLLFVSDRDGGRDVYQLELKSSGESVTSPRRLTTGLNPQAISLSIDGRRLVYSVFTESSNIWSLPVPAGAAVSISEARPITSGNQMIESVGISPDGRWVAFDSDRSGSSDIYRAPLAGGEPEQLTTDPAQEFWPAWSPDGREIAFHSFHEGARHIYMMDADGKHPAQVTSGSEDERTPGWSPDGRAIYFIHNFNGVDTEIRFVQRDDAGRWGEQQSVLRADVFPPLVSPDGQWLAYTSGQGLWVTTVTGGSPRQLVPVDDRNKDVRPIYVAWSSDGRNLYYLAVDPTDRASIWSISPVGGTPRLLVEFDDPQRPWHRFGFTAHDGRLYFTLGDLQSDLWMAEVAAGNEYRSR